MNKSKIAIYFFPAVFFLLFFSLIFGENLKFAAGQFLASINIYSKSEIIDSGGFGNSFALSSGGSPAASYINEKEGLIFAEKKAEGGWKKEIVDFEAFAGNATSLAFDGKGDPNILYIDFEEEPSVLYGAGKNFSLKLAIKINDNWQIEKIFNSAALSCNLIFDENNTTHISFWSPLKGLMYGKKINGKWKIETVESVGVGWWNDLALGGADKEKFYISYYDFNSKDLLCAFFDDARWQKEIVDFEGDVGRFNSIFADKENNPHISYFDEENSNLKYAIRTDSGWEIETADKEGGERTNILLDEKCNPVISYISSFSGEAEIKFLSEDQVEKNLNEKKDFRVNENNFRLARKNGYIWQIRNIDSGEIGDNSFLIDNNGNIHLLWQNMLSNELKYLNFSF